MANTRNPQAVVAALKTTLADTVTFAFRVHGYHWNVTGPDFSEYHALFDAIYSDVDDSIDPIAENILKIGGFAPYTLQELASIATLKDVPRPSSAMGMVDDLLEAIDGLLTTTFLLFAVAQGANQQGIANFAADRIDHLQKWAWQLRATAGLQTGEFNEAPEAKADQVEALNNALANLKSIVGAKL